MKRKLILRNFQSPGDIVMLTAAVRDLHKCCPGQYLTDVRTPCAGLWANNRYLAPLKTARCSGVSAERRRSLKTKSSGFLPKAATVDVQGFLPMWRYYGLTPLPL